MKRLLMWDVDRTLLHLRGVPARAFATAFTDVTGLPFRLPPSSLAGRTDLHITAEAFTHNGLADHAGYLEPFFERYAARFGELTHLIPEAGGLLPGAREVLTALAGRDDVVQTLVTGNIKAVAEAKLAAFGLADVVDLAIGGYGTEDHDRATLVRGSLQRARTVYGEFGDVLVIGDTVHDIAAALANGMIAVGVATGPSTVAELLAAGAHVALPSLADVEAVVALLTSIDTGGALPAGGRGPVGGARGGTVVGVPDLTD